MTMDVSFIGRNITIPDRFREYAEEKFDKVDKLSNRAQRLDVKVTKEAHARVADTAITVELTVVGRGKVIRAEAQAEDKFAAFDLAYGKFMERLRRARDKAKDHQARGRNNSVAEVTAAFPVVDTSTPLSEALRTQDEEPEEEFYDDVAPVQIRRKVFPAQPMSVTQAVDAMELVGHDFYLFVDADTNRPSAVYRRKGWSYGAISLDPDHPDAETIEEEVEYEASK